MDCWCRRRQSAQLFLPSLLIYPSPHHLIASTKGACLKSPARSEGATESRKPPSPSSSATPPRGNKRPVFLSLDASLFPCIRFPRHSPAIALNRAFPPPAPTRSPPAQSVLPPAHVSSHPDWKGFFSSSFLSRRATVQPARIANSPPAQPSPHNNRKGLASCALLWAVGDFD